MCIIAVYKQGTKPTLATIKTMMARNSDGAGVGYNNGRSVKWKKGFKTAEAVYAYIQNAYKHGARDVIFHARIATSGGINSQKCHPFLLSDNVNDLNRTAGRTKRAIVFHNGVFSIDIEKGLSDTQTFVKTCLAPISERVIQGKADALLEMAVHGSRLAILTPNGFHTYGATWNESDGVKYSNYSYREWTPTYTTSRGGYWQTVNKNGRTVWEWTPHKYIDEEVFD